MTLSFGIQHNFFAGYFIRPTDSISILLENMFPTYLSTECFAEVSQKTYPHITNSATEYISDIHNVQLGPVFNTQITNLTTDTISDIKFQEIGSTLDIEASAKVDLYFDNVVSRSVVSALETTIKNMLGDIEIIALYYTSNGNTNVIDVTYCGMLVHAYFSISTMFPLITITVREE